MADLVRRLDHLYLFCRDNNSIMSLNSFFDKQIGDTCLLSNPNTLIYTFYTYLYTFCGNKKLNVFIIKTSSRSLSLLFNLFNEARTHVRHSFKSYFWCVGYLRWEKSLPIFREKPFIFFILYTN